MTVLFQKRIFGEAILGNQTHVTFLIGWSQFAKGGQEWPWENVFFSEKGKAYDDS